jgi:hypothetical protein
MEIPVADSLPEYHLYEDLSLTPAYAMGYAFHALGRINAKTSVHGRRGALALLNELFATLTLLKLETSLHAVEPVRVQLEVMMRRPRSSRIGPALAAEIAGMLASVEACVREEMRARGGTAGPPSAPAVPLDRSRVLLGEAALGQCPEDLRWEVTSACRALDAQLYTAAVFHLSRVWAGLPDRSARVAGSEDFPVADPRLDLALRCSKADATSVFAAVRWRLEALRGPPGSLE